MLSVEEIYLLGFVVFVSLLVSWWEARNETRRRQAEQAAIKARAWDGMWRLIEAEKIARAAAPKVCPPIHGPGMCYACNCYYD